MSQRPEDYRSTKNTGGNRKSGTDAVSGDPFAYLKLGKNHSYLGHFGKEKYLEQGHNDTPDPKKPIVEEGGFQTPPPPALPGSEGRAAHDPSGRPPAHEPGSPAGSLGGGEGTIGVTDTGGTMAPKLSARDRYRNEHPVTAAIHDTRGSVRAAKLGARSASLEAGGTRKEARAAGQAAKVTAKQSRRDVVGAARSDPNARGMERFAKGQAARTRRSARTSTL